MSQVKITLNGREHQTICTNLSELLQSLTLISGSIAIAINDEVIPSADYLSKTITNGDRVEIIHAVSGG